ncbi:hypothetical protein [uncultured Ilumatobacter sp.]|uniref:hypothetical protein n=1 Tax=uncultured Ilumatobacter sp. TaxID=879968 RepID=UPI00374EDB14
MYAVATFLVVAVLSMAFTRLAAGALIATGLPPDVASFQARSAFSGAGFTTTEAENVVNNPDSRKIISTTMFVGNLGTPTLVVTVLVGFLAPGPGNTVERVMVAISGLVLAVLLVTNRPMKRWLVKVGQQEAQRRLLPRLDNQVVELLAVGDDFVVGTVQVVAGTDSTVQSLRSIDDALPAVRVLGVQQSEGFFGTPPVDLELAAGDKIIAYGRRSDLQNLVED